MFKDMLEIYKFRELLWNLVVRDIKTRYKNSALGFLWSLLNPLIQVAIITIVFKQIMGFGQGNYSAYLLCGFLPWMFFNMTILDSCTSIIYQGSLIKKTYFPRELIPISVVLSNLIHFLLAFGVFFFYLKFKVKVPILETWLFFPLIVLIQAMFIMGISFFVAALNVFYEDVKYLATAILNLFLYATPIFYFIETIFYTERISAAWKPTVMLFYNLNPMALTITAYRKTILQPYNHHAHGEMINLPDIPFNYDFLWIALVTSFLIMILGYVFFNSKKWQFAERF